MQEDCWASTGEQEDAYTVEEELDIRGQDLVNWHTYFMVQVQVQDEEDPSP